LDSDPLVEVRILGSGSGSAPKCHGSPNTAIYIYVCQGAREDGARGAQLPLSPVRPRGLIQEQPQATHSLHSLLLNTFFPLYSRGLQFSRLGGIYRYLQKITLYFLQNL
jgi:hypothetical protein